MAERQVCFQEIVNDVNLLGDDNFVVERVLEYSGGKNIWISYLKSIATFDTETTSFTYDGMKCGYCYVWAMKINDLIITGRYLSEFKELCDMLVKRFSLSVSRRLVVWVHNLGFDFQFFRKYFEFNRVFSMDKYKPIKALSKCGIEFRDSYILTNSNLDNVAKNLRDKSLKKLIGDLDYDLMRHSETVITDTEWEYIYNDVRIVYQLIKERMEDENGTLTNIPMTSTGYVRRFVRNACYPKDNKKDKSKYRSLMKSLTIEWEEYLMLKEAFQGGFTHANANGVGFTHCNVGSYDITSSYPTVILARQFPMSKGSFVDCETLSEKMFDFYLQHYCCVMEITFYDIQSKTSFENIISSSRCRDIRFPDDIDPHIDNGRIIKAKELTTTITEVDLEVYKHYYSWSGFKVNKMITYAKGYLPKSIIECVLKLYGDKTSLKNVVGMEKEYQSAKALLNAIYGMMVTDIVRDEVMYDGAWSSDCGNSMELIEKYNKSYNRFLYYPWGIYVTAYARERLFDMIEHCGDDYLYSDTDSVKILHSELHADYLNKCNIDITNDIYKCLDYYNIDHELASPKTIKGESKPLGVWDYEGVYDQFKTLGAKRYFVQKHDEYELTVAGVSKKKACASIVRQAEEQGVSPFDVFDFGLHIPDDETGKQTHYYIDDEISGYMCDYQGNNAEFYSPSSVCLEPAEYNLTVSVEYDALLGLLKEGKFENAG